MTKRLPQTPYDTICVSGGFDPVHIGHLRMIQEAAQYGEVNTVCEALRRLKPTYFANGGDRKNNNTPEMNVCEKEGITLLWNIGGGKIQSSSDLVNDSGMVNETITEIDGIDITPSRVEVLTAGDIAKNGDY